MILAHRRDAAYYGQSTWCLGPNDLYLLLIFTSAELFFVDLNEFTPFRAELVTLGR